MTAATTAIMTAYLGERITRPGTALFCGPHGQHLSRDALEHRLALHLTTATARCPGLADKTVTMHTLRHTCAMNLLAAGVDVSVIALWIGRQNTHSTAAYLHADMAIKQAAIDRTRPADTEPGTFRPQPDILDWLSRLSICRLPEPAERYDLQQPAGHRHNNKVGIDAVMPTSA